MASCPLGHLLRHPHLLVGPQSSTKEVAGGYGFLNVHLEHLFLVGSYLFSFLFQEPKDADCSPAPFGATGDSGRSLRSYLLDTLCSHFYSSVSGLCWVPSWKVRHMFCLLLKCLPNLSRAQIGCGMKAQDFFSETHRFLPFHTSLTPNTGNIYTQRRGNFLRLGSWS